MRRAAFAIAATVAGLVLLLSFKTRPTSALATPATTTAAVRAATKTKVTTKTKAKVVTKTVATTRTVTGSVVETSYGPVQVQLTLKGDTITGVAAVQYPSSDPRSQQISAYAIPQLDQEALQAKSANISMISGASYTSSGYLSSLQSALSKAGL